MDTFVQEFSEFLIENELAANTAHSYASDMQGFFTMMGSDISTKIIRSYIEKLQAQNLSIKTINRKLVSLKQYIAYLNECKAAKLIVRIRQLKQQRQNYLEDILTPNDFASLVAAAEKSQDIRAKAIFYTLYYTGLRVSEMLQLHTADIYENTVTVKGKGSKFREVFISKKLQQVLKEYLEVRLNTAENALFTGQRGQINRQTVDRIIKLYAGKTRLKRTKAHAHNFRHLFCKTALEKGLSIDTIADLAGHTDINTTRIYTRKSKKELLAAIDKM
ncbi:MAG: tyrosine-type recombinase/integrase [Pelosinus sp.]|nr:tyrosine-type recombinase/integrase [Pelosinus sp.]